MKATILRVLHAALIILFCSLAFVFDLHGQNVRYARQGYSMRLCFNNEGVFGRVAYPQGINTLQDSIGLEYPIGSSYEHIFGGGLWVGGILDTSIGPTPAFVRAVTTAYEGWAGPYFEFFPGSSLIDSIWKVVGRGVPRPSSWETYWGNSIPRFSFSDNDHYCMYDDAHINVATHVPLHLKVIQSSYVWSDPYAEAVHIMEYKLVNVGAKQIDSAYAGIFIDGDVGPYGIPNYQLRNLTGYYPDIRLAYIHNPVDIGSTPVGITMLHASRSLDSLRFSYRWWPGAQHPGTDVLKYAILSSGQIDSNQQLTNLSDARCLVSFGPFTIRPPSSPDPDTVVAVFGIVSGQSLTAMRQHAVRAKAIYLNGGQVSVGQLADEVPGSPELLQNYPNPFNPATSIRFRLSHSGIVRLTITNMLGEEIAILLDREVTSGDHSILWDATGKPSGVYFCHLRAGVFAETKKLLLIR